MVRGYNIVILVFNIIVILVSKVDIFLTWICSAGQDIPVAKVPPKAKEHDPNAIKPKVYGNITVFKTDYLINIS